MAIEIAPKDRTKSKLKASVSQVLYYLVLALLVVTFLSYFVFNAFNKRAKNELKQLDIAISAKETAEVKALEQDALNKKTKIDIFADLLGSHKKTSYFFNFLQQNSHNNVALTKVELGSESAEAIVSGNAKSFKDLGEQIMIFQEKDIVKDVDLFDVFLQKQGGVGFELRVGLDPEIFY